MPERSRAAQSRVQRFLGVPDSWEGWAVRILTIVVMLTFVTQWLLAQQIAQVETQVGELVRLTQQQNTFMNESRTQRQSFQSEETARQCQLLRELGTSQEDLRALRC